MRGGERVAVADPGGRRDRGMLEDALDALEEEDGAVPDVGQLSAAFDADMLPPSQIVRRGAAGEAQGDAGSLRVVGSERRRPRKREMARGSHLHACGQAAATSRRRPGAPHSRRAAMFATVGLRGRRATGIDGDDESAWVVVPRRVPHARPPGRGEPGAAATYKRARPGAVAQTNPTREETRPRRHRAASIGPAARPPRARPARAPAKPPTHRQLLPGEPRALRPRRRRRPGRRSRGYCRTAPRRCGRATRPRTPSRRCTSRRRQSTFGLQGRPRLVAGDLIPVAVATRAAQINQ